MKLLRTSAVLAVAGGLCAPSAFADDAAKARLAEAIDFYRAAESLAVDIAVSVTNQGDEIMAIDNKLRLATPNRYLRETRSGDRHDFFHIHDGKGTLFVAEYEAAIAMETEDLEDTVGNDFNAQMLILPGFVVAESAESVFELMEFDAFSDEGAGEVRGHAVHSIRAASGDESYTFHIAAEGDPLIHGMTILPQPGIRVEIALTGQSVNAPIADSEFHRELPEGTTAHANMAAFMRQMRGPQPSDALLAKQAPGFQLVDMDGQPFDLHAKTEGKVVVLDFWATWCGPCVQALPVLVEVTNELKDQGVVFLAVNVREDRERVVTFQDRIDLRFPVLFDTEGDVAGRYMVQGIPQTVLIGRDGTVQAVHVGFSSGMGKTLAEELAALVEGKALVEGE